MSDIKPTSAQLRDLKRANAAYFDKLVSVPRAEWPTPPFIETNKRIAVYRSRKFLVQIFDGSCALRMSVCRTEWDERAKRWRGDISWDDLQRLKDECGFGDRWATELFPPNAAVVNVGNMRHVWLLEQAPDYGWNRALTVAR